MARQDTQSYCYYYKEKVTGSFIQRKDSPWKIDKQVATYQAAITFDLATKLKELNAQVTKTFKKDFLYDDRNLTEIVKMSFFCTENGNARRQYVKLVKWIYLLDELIFLSKGYVKSFHIGKGSSPHLLSLDFWGLWRIGAEQLEEQTVTAPIAVADNQASVTCKREAKELIINSEKLKEVCNVDYGTTKGSNEDDDRKSRNNSRNLVYFGVFVRSSGNAVCFLLLGFCTRLYRSILCYFSS